MLLPMARLHQWGIASSTSRANSTWRKEGKVSLRPGKKIRKVDFGKVNVYYYSDQKMGNIATKDFTTEYQGGRTGPWTAMVEADGHIM